MTIAGKPAYVAYISPTQINALASPDTPAGAVDVQVTTTLGTSARATGQSQAAAPSFFLWAGKYAVATRADYTLAAANGLFTGMATAPAKPGEIIILWGTGFGVTNPAVPAGQQPRTDTVYAVVNAPAVTIGKLAAPVIGAALASGSVGLYQIAVRIPDSAPNGDLAVAALAAVARGRSICGGRDAGSSRYLVDRRPVRVDASRRNSQSFCSWRIGTPRNRQKT
jgi:uncharacterized protein (TIGR03437 family)